ncbi:helix-turn-helix domain-containing protein [Streptomyces sp. NPDC052309]|uniref:helix-turn-helix domain-containing protein n=1 Tax=Streptomyces sp. NPDC052309 TaxID=3155421 RepID=UPI00343540E2
MGARATTAAVADADGSAALRAALSAWLAPLLVGPAQDGAPSVSAALHRLGYVRLIACGTGPLRLSRTPRLIAQDAGDGVVLVLPRDATVRLAQHGRGATVTTRDLALVDLRSPFSLEQQDPGRLLLFRFPTHALNLPSGVLSCVTGRALATGQGVSALLAPLLLELGTTADRVPQPVGVRLGGIVTEFVAAMVDELTEHRGGAPGTAPDHLITTVRRYIDEHLDDPGLNADGIAAAHGISVRYLHRLFESEGITVGKLIQQSRVERCARELTRRGRVNPSITAVALRWGFRSPAHFSRAFKAVHGHAPRQWRTAVTEDAERPQAR